MHQTDVAGVTFFGHRPAGDDLQIGIAVFVKMRTRQQPPGTAAL
jgi:hypothetical protein